jgi:adenine deaminase
MQKGLGKKIILLTMEKHRIAGMVVDVVGRRVFKGEIEIENGKICALHEIAEAPEVWILPGLVDAHIHVESSMLVPSAFARLAVRHGTVATISDPHEIANVCGEQGVDFMISNGKQTPFKFHFGAPSCVPATSFETAGAELDVEAVARLLDRDDIYYLAEMMNWPGVLQRDPMVMAKIEAAHQRGKPVDGHAPGLKGERAAAYVSAGISTDHECFTAAEALDKLKLGMKVLIREGSAAKNYEALIDLLPLYPDHIMFCSDDKHPDDLEAGHINQLVARSLARGFDLFDVLRACTVNPAKHYRMRNGLLQPGDAADFVLVKSLETMEVQETWIDGVPVYKNGAVLFPEVAVTPINRFATRTVSANEFEVKASRLHHPVIVAYDGELITGREQFHLEHEAGVVKADPSRDILKIAVVNRYYEAPVSVSFIKNFGLKNGAMASSVAHDSHNVIVIGSDDEAMARVVNLVMESRGGIAAVHGAEEKVLPLPVAGIMTAAPGKEASAAYASLNAMAKAMGSTLKAPFMLISFMALLVIPSLKMSDKGLFDGERFEFV